MPWDDNEYPDLSDADRVQFGVVADTLISLLFGLQKDGEVWEKDGKLIIDLELVHRLHQEMLR
jgi:hypothetical protein